MKYTVERGHIFDRVEIIRVGERLVKLAARASATTVQSPPMLAGISDGDASASSPYKSTAPSGSMNMTAASINSTILFIMLSPFCIQNKFKIKMNRCPARQQMCQPDSGIAFIIL